MAATPRPPAVTMACVFVGLSSFLMLAQLIGLLTTWGSTEMQDALQPLLRGLGDGGVEMSMPELLRILRWLGLGSILLLVAGMVFAVYAIRGDRVSRVGATVIAVVLAMLVIVSGLIGILLGAFLLFAAGTLWAPDARRWYAADSGSTPDLNADLTETTPDSDSAPNPWTAPTTNVQTVEPQTQTMETQTPPAPTTHRPSSILAAGLVTVIGSTIAGAMAGVYLLIYGFIRAEFVRSIEEGPFADWYQPGQIDDSLRTIFWASLVVLPLAVAGLGAGMSLLARLPIGRIATLALAWITTGVGLVMTPVTFPLGLLGLFGTGAAIAVIVLLNRDESRAWAGGGR